MSSVHLITQKPNCFYEIQSKSYNMFTSRKEDELADYKIVKEGLLDAKIPNQKKPIRKNWNRFRVVALASRSTEECDSGNDVVLSLYPPPTGSKDSDNELYRVEVRGAVSVFRCDSKSRFCRAFGIMRHSQKKDRPATVLIYLAGEDEKESEIWMTAIRNALLPPLPLVQLEEVWHERHQVSLIDSIYSFQRGLLGTYGCLWLSEEEIVIVHPHIGRPIAGWPWNCIRDCKLLRADSEDGSSGVFGVVLTENKKRADLSRSHMLAFYSPTARVAVHQVKEKLLYKRVDQSECTEDKSPNQEDLIALQQDFRETESQSSRNSIIWTENREFFNSPHASDERFPRMEQHYTAASNESTAPVKEEIEKKDNFSCDDSFYTYYNGESPSNFISGITSSIFDYKANTPSTNSCVTQSHTSRSSSGSSDSSGGFSEAQLWPKLWEEFFEKQEERMAKLQVSTDANNVGETRYENALPLVDITELTCAPQAPINNISEIAPKQEGIKVILNGECCSEGQCKQTCKNMKRGSVTSILSHDSHIYADIPSFTDCHGRGSIGGVTLYEELSDDDDFVDGETLKLSPSPPPLPPPREKLRRPSTLKLKELSHSIEDVLNRIEMTSISSQPVTPEKRRKASPTAWLNPVKGFKKILTKDKKTVDENKFNRSIYYTSFREKPAVKSTKVKRTTSQPIFYYDRNELRRKANPEDSPSSFNTDDLPIPFQPLIFKRTKEIEGKTDSSETTESPVEDLPQQWGTRPQICLGHLLENLKKGETADVCECSNSDSRWRSVSSPRLQIYQHHRRRKSKSLSLEIEKHLRMLNHLDYDRAREQVSPPPPPLASLIQYQRQESSEYFDMTPPSNRRNSTNHLSPNEGSSEDCCETTSDEYMYMKNLES